MTRGKNFKIVSGGNIGNKSKKTFGCENCNFALDHSLWKKDPNQYGVEYEHLKTGCACPKCKTPGVVRLFDSHAEYTRAAELKLMRRAGDIWDLEYQVRFDLHVPGPNDIVKIGQYVADFTYSTYRKDPNGNLLEDWIVEDVKNRSMAVTDIFAWKRKHFEAEYGIEINMVGR